MKIPKSILGKVALGLGGLGAIAGAGVVVAVTTTAPNVDPKPTDAKPGPVEQAVKNAITSVEDTVQSVFHSFDGCPACGMG